MGLFGGSKNPEGLIHQAMILMENRQPKAAISLFKKALKNDPKMLQHCTIRVLR